MDKKQEVWAIFWCSLLRPILLKEIETSDNAYLTTLSKKKTLFPNGEYKRPKLSTLKRKLGKYREGGFDALARKRRSDRGKPRSVSSEVLDTAIKVKKDLPRRPARTINAFVQKKHGETIKHSTLYRHLKQAGATAMKLGVSGQPVRKRWTRDRTHALWVGDFEEGPYVIHNDEILPTYLSAFIDCFSRWVVEARYYLRQNLDILVDSLIRAWVTHGSPVELYVDNAKVYLANALEVACCRMNINKLRRRPKDPAGGGLIERFFETCQGQFESEIRAGEIPTLEYLNRSFSAWLDVDYHDARNSETGQTPRARYQQGLTVIRQVDLQQALASFLRQEKRKVNPDFSDVRLDNRFYRVDKSLRGDWVKVLWDPFSHIETVQIHTLDDVYLCQGVLHHREIGEAPQPYVQKKPKYDYPALLIEKHEARLAAQAQGIDYRKISASQRWPFPAFVQTFARLFAQKGGLGAFSAGDLERLKKLYNSSTTINEALLRKAFENAPQKTLTHIGHELRIVTSRKEP